MKKKNMYGCMQVGDLDEKVRCLDVNVNVAPACYYRLDLRKRLGVLADVGHIPQPSM